MSRIVSNVELFSSASRIEFFNDIEPRSNDINHVKKLV